MKEPELTHYKIEKQGGPVVNHIFIEKKYAKLVALVIDLKSKHCEVGGWFGDSDGKCGILIQRTKDSLYLKKNKEKEYDFTEISFPDYKGFDIFGTYCGRYNINVVLIKR